MSSRRARVSVNALVLHSLVGIGAGSVHQLRRDERVGQADQLELAVVAVEESMRPIGEEPEVPKGYLLVPKDAWQRIESVFSDDGETVDEIARMAEAAVRERNELKVQVEKLTEYRDGDFACLRQLCGELGLSVSSWDVITARAKFLTSEAAKVEGLEVELARIRAEVGETNEIATQALHEGASLENELGIHKEVLKQKDAEIARLNRELDAMAQRALMPTAVEEAEIPPLAPDPIQAIEDFEPMPQPLTSESLVASAPTFKYVDRPAVLLEPQEVLNQVRGPVTARPHVKPWELGVTPEQAYEVVRLTTGTEMDVEAIAEKTGITKVLVRAAQLLLGSQTKRLRGLNASERETVLQGYLANWKKREELAKEPVHA